MWGLLLYTIVLHPTLTQRAYMIYFFVSGKYIYFNSYYYKLKN